MKGIMSDEWVSALSPFIESEQFDKIIGTIRAAKAVTRVLPNTDQMFRAFNLCPPNTVKVVMCLQDPYHQIINGEPVADGVTMSCSNTGIAQPSLKYYMSEVTRTIGHCACCEANRYDLGYLGPQGVLTINRALSVKQGLPNSHNELWDPFMDYLFHEVINKSIRPIIYLTFGKEAVWFTRYARMGDYLISAAHPASAAYRGGAWDCADCFNRVNRYLELNDSPQINW